MTRSQFPGASDWDDPQSQPPDSKTLNYLAVLRQESPSDEGSTADEDAPPAGSGWRGSGKPIMMGKVHLKRGVRRAVAVAAAAAKISQKANDGWQSRGAMWRWHVVRARLNS